MSEQADAVQRESCERCFRSRGLAVHRCRRPEESPDSTGGTAAAAPQGQVVCRECGRTLPQMVVCWQPWCAQEKTPCSRKLKTRSFHRRDTLPFNRRCADKTSVCV